MNIKSYLCVCAGLILWMACQSGHQPDLPLAGMPVEVSQSGTEASCVYLSGDESGEPVMSWVEVDSSGKKILRISFWEGKTGAFSDIKSFSLPEHTSVHEEGMPKTAVKGDGTLMVFFEVSVSSPHSKWGVSDIWFVSSPDRGGSWTAASSVFPEKPEKFSISFSGVARLADGEIGIGWLGTSPDPDATGRAVYFARTSGGEKFGEPVLVDPSACECCRVAVSASEDGKVMVAYRDLLPGSVRDISLVISDDGGKSFSDPIPFTGDDWEVEGCPHNGPSLAAAGDRIRAAWFTNGSEPGAYLAEIDASGQVIRRQQLSSSAQFVQATVSPSGAVIAVYNENFEEAGERYSRIRWSGGEAGTMKGDVVISESLVAYPVVQSIGDRDFVVAWKENGKVYYRILNVNNPDLFVGHVKR